MQLPLLLVLELSGYTLPLSSMNLGTSEARNYPPQFCSVANTSLPSTVPGRGFRLHPTEANPKP